MGNILETIKGSPYLFCLTGFVAVVAYGLFKLLAIVQALGVQ